MKTLFGEFFNQNRGDIRMQRKAIEEVLKKGPLSVSMISKETTFKKDLLMWNLLGMLRWGSVEVSGEEDHELVFTLKEV